MARAGTPREDWDGAAEDVRYARESLTRRHLAFVARLEEERQADLAKHLARADQVADSMYQRQPARQARRRERERIHARAWANHEFERKSAPTQLPDSPGWAVGSVIRSSNSVELGCHLSTAYVEVNVIGDIETQARALAWLWHLENTDTAPPDSARVEAPSVVASRTRALTLLP